MTAEDAVPLTVDRIKQQIQSAQIAAANAKLSVEGLPMATLVPDSPWQGLDDTVDQLLKLTREKVIEERVAEAHRRIVPTRLVSGMLPMELLLQERHRVVERIKELRLKQLQAIPQPSMQDQMAIKACKLASLQQKMRAQVAGLAVRLEQHDAATGHLARRPGKRQSARELRLAERQQRQQKQDKIRRERQSHYDWLNAVMQHGKELDAQQRAQQQKTARLYRQVMAVHGAWEREESRRQERVAKERLKALRADDEEGYLRLLDQQKDTRLTYLLKQTDEFLEGLTERVRVQQREVQGGISMEPVEPVEGVEEGMQDYYHTAHQVKETVTKQPSILVGGQLKDYQMKGLQWLVSLYNNHLNGILADEMGLGKTIQTISLLSHLIETKGQTGPYLVIVPLSTMTNWAVEFERWAPSIPRIEYKGNPAQRKALQLQLKQGRFSVLLTTYEYILKDRPFLSKIKWLYMIVDEGHRMKNAHSKLSTTLSNYYTSRFRLLLTGTPLQNNLPELWALLNFVLPRIFHSCRTFEDWFNAPFAHTGEKVELNEEETLLIIRRLHKVLRPFLLRRMKKDVESELPDKVEKVIRCPMSAAQQHLYTAIRSRGYSQGSLGIKRLNNTLMQLRKICNHPFVFEEVEKQLNPVGGNNELLYRVAGKFEMLYRILPKLKHTGHRVMTIMEDFLNTQGLAYLRLDGSTKAEDRSELLGKFNAPDSPYFCFLLSTRAGGLGLNLQTADTVIIFDSDWNPHQDLQAQDRAHRIGQTKEVRILRLVTVDSIEEYILERAQFKLSLDGKVIQAGKFDQKSTNEEREAMLKAIFEQEQRREGGEDASEDGEDVLCNDEELNDILARSEEELEVFKRLDDQRRSREQTMEKQLKRRVAGLLEASELPKSFKTIEDEEEPAGPFDYQAEVRRARTQAVNYNERESDARWLANLMVDEQDDDVSQGSPAKGRKRKTPQPSSELEEYHDEGLEEDGAPKLKLKLKKQTPPDVALVIERVIGALESATDADGRLRCELFLQLPSRTEYPDYYRHIRKPISLAEIRTRPYSNLSAFMADVDLMFANAMQYNVEGSMVYEDARHLKDLAHSLQ